MKKLKENNFYINNEYNPIYTLQGLFVAIAGEKGGISEIQKILEYNDIDEMFAKYFKLKGSEKIDKFIKSELKNRTIKLVKMTQPVISTEGRNLV